MRKTGRFGADTLRRSSDLVVIDRPIGVLAPSRIVKYVQQIFFDEITKTYEKSNFLNVGPLKLTSLNSATIKATLRVYTNYVISVRARRVSR